MRFLFPQSSCVMSVGILVNFVGFVRNFLVILFIVGFIGCGEANVETGKNALIYDVKIKATENGALVAVPDRGESGTEIKLLVNPQPGYKLQSIKRYNQGVSIADNGVGTDISQNALFIYSFIIEDASQRIEAQFVPLADGERSVTVATGDHGVVIPVHVSGGNAGTAGSHVRLYTYVDAGYAFTGGVPTLDGGTWVTGKEGYEFTISGSGNVGVHAAFERSRDAGPVLERAELALDAGEFDIAFSYFEDAYAIEPSEPRAALYSSIGKLFGILNDTKVSALLKKPGLGTRGPPTTINGWLDFDTTVVTKWLTVWTDDQGTEYTLPRIATPNSSMWPGGFLNYTIIQKNGGKRKLFDTLIFYNMIQNNTGGFNDFLDDTLEYVFGKNYNVARTRALAFPADSRVTVHPVLADKFALDELFGATVTVGKEELGVLFAALDGLKALFEAAASYNWEADLTVLGVEIGDGDTLNVILDKVLTKRVKERLDKEGSFLSLASILPLRNRFLKVRNAGLMDRARKNFTDAAEWLAANFAVVYPRLASAKQSELAWMNGEGGMLRALSNAAKGGGVFWVPEVPQYRTVFDAMQGQNAWVTAEAADTGINLSKFFTPGALTLDKIIATSAGGKAPRFVGFHDGNATGTVIGAESELASYDTYGLEFGTGFKETFVKIKGKTDYKWIFEIFPDFFPQSTAPEDIPERQKASSNVELLFGYYEQR